MLDYKEMMRVLWRHSVDYIVVGGVSAALNGAPIVTLDLDIVHSRSPRNIPALATALTELEAVYRDPAETVLRPSESHLASSCHHLLKTRAGPLDLLGTVGLNPEQSYEDLFGSSQERHIADMTVRVLNLARLIQLKEELRGEKDVMVLNILKRTLEEHSRR